MRADDPLFFDPDADTPRVMDPDAADAGFRRMFEEMIERADELGSIRGRRASSVMTRLGS